MRLRDAMSAPSTMDIIYGVNDKGAGDETSKKPLGMAAGRKFRQVDRSQQGAALSGHPNVLPQKAVDSQRSSVVEFTSPAPMTAHPAAPLAPTKDKKMASLTLKGLNKKGTQAIYSGTPGTVRIGLAAFPGKTAPESIEVADGVFAIKTPKVKLSKEERAALPKPTEAEKIAKMEARLAKAKAKLASQSADI